MKIKKGRLPKDLFRKMNQLAVICNKDRFNILLALYSSEVLKMGPEFKKKK